MMSRKGFSTAATLLVVVGIVVVAGVVYVAMSSQTPERSAGRVAGEAGAENSSGDRSTGNSSATPSIKWQLTDTGDTEGTPHTAVAVTVNGSLYQMGTFIGSCSEIGAGGGIDGKGLLAGELSAVQCWFAGGGNEIGVFAHEDGGYQIMVGELSEGEEGAGMFRGDFDVRADIAP